MGKMLTILGPTASGKTALAVEVARRVGGEILSADSRQVFRAMDIGTGKDMDEYGGPAGLAPVAVHLVDIALPGEDYNIWRYQRDFARALAGVEARGRVPIVCGGSGLYAESVLRGYGLAPVGRNEGLRRRLAPLGMDELRALLEERYGRPPHRAARATATRERALRAIEIADHRARHPEEQEAAGAQRESLNFCLWLPAEERWRRIRARLQQRMEAGLEAEVRALVGAPGGKRLPQGVEPVSPERLMAYGLEYKYVTLYVLGRMGRSEMLEALYVAIRQFAKRQMTWFRGMERRGLTLEWIDASEATTPEMAAHVAERWEEWTEAAGAEPAPPER